MFDVKELVAGIVYEDGEPEVRARDLVEDAQEARDLLLITCDLSDDDAYVATCAALFASDGSDRGAMAASAQANLKARIEAMPGKQISERLAWMREAPDDLFSFMAKHLIAEGRART